MPLSDLQRANLVLLALQRDPGSYAARAAVLNRDGPRYSEDGQAVQPDLAQLGRYQRNPGAPRGVWPSSSEIGQPTLERHARDAGTVWEQPDPAPAG